MATEQLKLSNQVCFRLYSVSRLVIQAYRPLLDRLGITYPMMNGVMHLIKEFNATIVSQEFDNVCKVSLRIRQRDAQLLRSRLAQLSFQ